MATDYKPFSQACENNKAPILAVLQTAFAHATQVLEIGSGTGQHAVYFAEHLPGVVWQPSDMQDNLDGIRQWVNNVNCPRLLQPLLFDVRDQRIPEGNFDAVFSANTLHIMAWENVRRTFQHLATLAAGTVLCIYGPFNYQGQFTSVSNARFNDWLVQQNSESGIRDFEAVNELANGAGFQLQQDHEMPANNRLLHWIKTR